MKNIRSILVAIMATQTVVALAQRLPAARTATEWEQTLRNGKQQESQFGKTTNPIPGPIRYPGEFEESQAVCISWSGDYDNFGNMVGVDTTSEFGWVSAQLTKYISDELPVWIRIPRAADSIAILTKMNSLGWPLTQNYRFIITQGDDWWMRDYGPNGVYWGTQDSLAFIDFKYYDGRDLDNLFPQTVANVLNIRNFPTQLNAEGGNFMSDGFGKVFFSDVVTDANDQILGWDSAATMDTVTSLFGGTQNIILKALECDGGTGHIDLYTKLADEQTLFVMEYPNVVTAQDRRIIEDNYQYMTTLRTTYNRPFRIIRFPMPTSDNGTYTRRSCFQINNDARTFLNGITLNKTFIYPSYSDSINGNKNQTIEATQRFEKYMSGYKVIPIDARAVSPGGGSIHCITMQIPASNPVLIWHPSVDGYQAIQPSYRIEARITNASGIAVAQCKWKLRGTTMWNTVNLTAGTNNLFSADITPGNLTETDTIDYYITATTQNGKTVTKPITAPQGYYTMQFKGYPTNVNELVQAKNHLFGAYPNPANQSITIPVQVLNASEITWIISDITGKEVMRKSASVSAGLHQERFSVQQLNAGVYLYTVMVNGALLDTRKCIVQP